MRKVFTMAIACVHCLGEIFYVDLTPSGALELQSVGRTALQPRGDTLPRDATRQPYDLPVETGGGLALDLFVAFARNAYAIQGHRMASDRRRRFRQGNGRTR